MTSEQTQPGMTVTIDNLSVSGLNQILEKIPENNSPEKKQGIRFKIEIDPKSSQAGEEAFWAGLILCHKQYNIVFEITCEEASNSILARGKQYCARFQKIFGFGGEKSILFPENIEILEDEPQNIEILKDEPPFLLYIDKDTIHRLFVKDCDSEMGEYLLGSEQNLSGRSPVYAIICKSLGKSDDQPSLPEFAEAYTRGLYELAKNIVEHSGIGMGMITISGDKQKEEIESYVFDLGEEGIIEKLKESTKKKVASPPFEKDRSFYDYDLNILENQSYKLEYLINPNPKTQLNQQLYRKIAHYGIMNFYDFIHVNNGRGIISSKSGSESYHFNNNSNEKPLCKGTYYHFTVPFSEAKDNQESPTQSNTLLSPPQDIKELSDFLTLRGITECKHDKIDSIAKNDGKFLAIDMDGYTGSAPDLLRLMTRLSEQHRSQALIIYNLEYKKYEEMIETNRRFYTTLKELRGRIPYWYRDKGILIYTRLQLSNTSQNKNPKYFYFADILYGETEKEFATINHIVSHTFPNTLSINTGGVSPMTNFEIPECLKPFFSGSFLLPFDLELHENSGDNQTSIFNANFKFLLEQELEDRNKPKSTSEEKLEKYIKSLGGYKISGAHFKIGAKVHSEDFYYAKGLFQNSYYAARLAVYLTKKIIESLKKENSNLTLVGEEDSNLTPVGEKDSNLTLVGYERYSELLLSLITELLKAAKFKNINHCLATDLGKDISYLPEAANDATYYKKNIVIIVPITSTGSTTAKIIRHIERLKNEKIEELGRDQNFEKTKVLEEIKVHEAYTILQVFDPDIIKKVGKSLKKEDNDSVVIELKANWQLPSECKWCFPTVENGRERRSLFEINKPSLSPSLIFELPSAKSVREPTVNFDSVNFNGALIYRSKNKNNQHFLFSTRADILIQKNEKKIKDWLKALKVKLDVHPYDKIVILSPCQETNAVFINLVNRELFNASATIIHHQPELDYHPNFGLFNETYLKNEHTKIFYVDDNQVSGDSFFKIYDLFRYISAYKKALSGAIFLCDKSSPDIHTRASRAVGDHLYSFVNINLPSHPVLPGNNYWEQEIERYKNTAALALHDAPRKHFTDRSIQLHQGRKGTEHYVETEKERHLRRFRIVHKTFEFFHNIKEKDEPWDWKIEDGLLKTCIQELQEFNELETKISIMKILSQNPFFIYKQIREKVFDWHNKWLKETITNILKKEEITLEDIGIFKFLTRRGVFLGNFQITEKSTFKAINHIFNNCREEDRESEKFKTLEKFILCQYIELIEKNGACAKEIISSIEHVENDAKNTHAKKLFRMLKIESASVLNTFMIHLKENINNEEYKPWHELFIDLGTHKPDIETAKKEDPIKKIKEEFEKYYKKLIAINKYKSAEETLKMQNEEGLNKVRTLKEPFLNYLWIKKLLHLYSIAKKDEKSINIKEKTKDVFDILKKIFTPKNNKEERPKAFFIVVDGKNNDHIVYNDDNVLSLDRGEDIVSEFFKETEIENRTIFEYGKDENGLWENLYTDESKTDDPEIQKKFTFLDDNNWLLLIRITETYKGAGEIKSPTLGVMGFFSKKDFSSDYQARQLLMLLRDDMESYIQENYNNKAFAELRLAEAIERFAYLAGHGRQMMQDLAAENKIFREVVSTMENLQYLIAIKMIGKDGSTKEQKDDNINDEMRHFESNEITEKEINKIITMGKKIFTSHQIENKVEIDIVFDSNEIKNSTFKFNKNLLHFICFELLVNAKKNRFNFIGENKNNIKNELKIWFKQPEKDILKMEFSGTGPKIEQNIINNITRQNFNKIKSDSEISGLRLINRIIKFLNEENTIEIESNPYKDYQPDSRSNYSISIHKNTFTITLNSVPDYEKNINY